jgi:hypothetical protein
VRHEPSEEMHQTVPTQGIKHPELTEARVNGRRQSYQPRYLIVLSTNQRDSEFARTSARSHSIRPAGSRLLVLVVSYAEAHGCRLTAAIIAGRRIGSTLSASAAAEASRAGEGPQFCTLDGGVWGTRACTLWKEMEREIGIHTIKRSQGVDIYHYKSITCGVHMSQ